MALQPTDINLGIPARGPKGDKGDQGPQGVQGPQGNVGPQGIQGVPGKPFDIKKAYNSVADMNANFSSDLDEGDFCVIASNVEDKDNADLYVRQGAKMKLIVDLSGATGIQGPAGPQGPQGVQGSQGNVGPQGPKGDTGKSAYQVWLDAGHSGTETEFINSLKGAKGDTGSQGPKGATGEQGPVGPQGPKGDQGPRGIQGISYKPYISEDGNWHLKKVENATEPDIDTGAKATHNIDTSDEFTVKKPSEYSEGFSYELKEVFELIPDRSNLDSTAQDGFQAIVTTEVCKGYARQTLKVIDSQRPLTFIRNGSGDSWYPWELITTW